ncbi:carboxymuconolactone decarboxylase family protein [Streptomyces sp. YIM 98790]|uniref:carboxymuconolactone decarboxylase family protein n=1 Tax=Streptomyces sp. YIM 98790 TaxID=2689077 RepID=UPI00140A3D90|nr:carboxymuconolactone decarboxylase family protein [Streptomyces sp. YIM 98790]
MTRIPAHTAETAPPAARDTLQAFGRKAGKVLTIYGGMAHAPVTLQTHAAIENTLEQHGTFDAPTRQAIALTVAAANHCTYCQAAHTAAGRAAGLSEQQTLAIRRGNAGFDPKLEALLAVVREITRRTGEVSTATWQAALAAGWTDTQLTEAFAHTMANIFTTYFTHFAGTELDLPPAPPLDH